MWTGWASLRASKEHTSDQPHAIVEKSALSEILKSSQALSSGLIRQDGEAGDEESLQHSHAPYLTALAIQVIHNLRYQHAWTRLRLHTHSPLDNAQILPRPLISGLPPHRIYVHPDDQIEELKTVRKGSNINRELEWVLPTRLKEPWSLRRFGDIFDSLTESPSIDSDSRSVGASRILEQGLKSDENVPDVKIHTGTRRGGKRLLLATVGDDSTVAYYIVHDGIVKPRQN